MAGIKEELQQLAAAMNAKPEPIASISAVYRFKLKGGEQFEVVLNQGSASVMEDAALPADCTITLSEPDMRKMLRNELNTTLAYMTGAVKVDGKLALALKLLEAVKSYV